MRHLGKIGFFAALLALVTTLAHPAPAGATLLSFTLSSPLKKDACAGDTDGDCLDNSEEQSLAWIASPWYFYDEDEGCAGPNHDALHFSRRDYFQVRPRNSGVAAWSPATTTTKKWVAVTYFFLYPHDCGIGSGFFGGHQGDSENVVYSFYSYDLRTWYLYTGRYFHHGTYHDFTGEYLQARASEIGTAYPSVAADEDMHGSWPGKAGYSQDCAGDEDDICSIFRTCDCFNHEIFRDAFAKGYREIVPAVNNVGGPPPERWNASLLNVWGAQGENAYTSLDVGHGSQAEYWTPQSGMYSKFCGWECPWNVRKPDGDCNFDAHGESVCADGPLSSKVDTAYFQLGTPPPPPPNPDPDPDPDPGPCMANCLGGTTTLTAANPLRVSRVEGLVSEQAARLKAAAGKPEEQDDHGRWLARRAEDPVAALVPTLLGVPQADQLRILRWMLTAPEPQRLAGLFDDLRQAAPPAKAPFAVLDRGDQAVERVLDLIALLESKGLRAPAPSAGFKAAGPAEEPEGGR